jgi:hypothetical protein
VIYKQRRHNSLLTYIITGAALLIACIPCLFQYIEIEDTSCGLFPVSPGTSLHAGKTFEYRRYVAPGDEAVRELAAGIGTIQDVYAAADAWVYVQEPVLYGVDDNWVTPHEFLEGTPGYPANPVPGIPVGDCEEQANTLVSLLRAVGTPPEEVRVVLGKVTTGVIDKGHVWAEIYINGEWLALDPSQGPYWDSKNNILVPREGVGFFYYETHNYPVQDVTACYNDIYYMETDTSEGYFPELWR